jgi:hypothetical protein
MPMASETSARDGPVDTLFIPDAPAVLEEDNYPDVPYWHDSVWAQHIDRQKDRGKTVSKLGFLTDQDGCPVSESRIKGFMSHAKQTWNELYRHRLDPSSWTKKTPTAAAFYAHEMRKKYEEFTYCDGNWKAERFAIIKYPDWCRDVRETGRLTRACTLHCSLFHTTHILSKVLVLPSARLARVVTGKTIANRRRQRQSSVPHLMCR